MHELLNLLEQHRAKWDEYMAASNARTRAFEEDLPHSACSKAEAAAEKARREWEEAYANFRRWLDEPDNVEVLHQHLRAVLTVGDRNG